MAGSIKNRQKLPVFSIPCKEVSALMLTCLLVTLLFTASQNDPGSLLLSRQKQSPRQIFV